MGLFSGIKKVFKKVIKGVKKVVKKVVGGVKKVVKKIGSSKILKALAIAAAVVVTGGAAIGAFTGGAGVAAGKFGATFANWMMTTSSNVLAGTGISGIKATTKLGKFAQGAAKVVAKPFGAVGTTAGNFAAGVTDFTGLTTESSRTGLSTQELSYFNEGDILAQEGSVAAKDASSFAETVVNPSTGIETAKTGFFDTTAGKVVSNVGTAVGTNVLTGAAMQYIQGDPEQQGSMAGGAVEGAEYMDPLQVYAAQQGINTDSIYQHMMYGNQDPSSQYGNQLYQQQTFGVA
jgi:hypothetical protein